MSSAIALLPKPFVVPRAAAPPTTTALLVAVPVRALAGTPVNALVPWNTPVVCVNRSQASHYAQPTAIKRRKKKKKKKKKVVRKKKNQKNFKKIA
jgi:hypothetical protein